MGSDVTAENFEEWNDEMARRFDPDSFHNHPSPIVRFIERRRVEVLLQLLDPRPGSRVLEVGCGAGNILERIDGAELHGVDLSDAMLEKAKQRLGERATVVKGDAADLPYEDQEFDRVYCSEVLEHVLDPHAVMAEMRRVVSHDGVVVASAPNEPLINRAKDVVMRFKPLARLLLATEEEGYHSVERMEDEWHLHEFDKSLLVEVAKPHFHIARIESIPVPGLPLRYVAQLIPR